MEKSKRQNHLIYTGKIGNDKHIVSASGKSFVSFGLSISEKQKDGEYKNVWINCVYFGGENEAEIKSGAVLTIHGRLGVNFYNDTATLRLVVESVELPENESDNSSASPQENQGIEDDNIPF